MVIAHYGYQDGSGEYFIVIDTDKCSGCGKCVEACPKNLLEMITDDYDELVPVVKGEFSHQLSYACDAGDCGYKCQEVCEENAISHSW